MKPIIAIVGVAAIMLGVACAGASFENSDGNNFACDDYVTVVDDYVAGVWGGEFPENHMPFWALDFAADYLEQEGYAVYVARAEADRIYNQCKADANL